MSLRSGAGRLPSIIDVRRTQKNILHCTSKQFFTRCSRESEHFLLGPFMSKLTYCPLTFHKFGKVLLCGEHERNPSSNEEPYLTFSTQLPNDKGTKKTLPIHHTDRRMWNRSDWPFKAHLTVPNALHSPRHHATRRTVPQGWWPRLPDRPSQSVPFWILGVQLRATSDYPGKRVQTVVSRRNKGAQTNISMLRRTHESTYI